VNESSQHFKLQLEWSFGVLIFNSTLVMQQCFAGQHAPMNASTSVGLVNLATTKPEF
jgi:hypothetical protein